VTRRVAGVEEAVGFGRDRAGVGQFHWHSFHMAYLSLSVWMNNCTLDALSTKMHPVDTPDPLISQYNPPKKFLVEWYASHLSGTCELKGDSGCYCSVELSFSQ
jgi:hypothetical protein